MDHEPDCGAVGPGSDLESGLCPLSLTGYVFPGEVGSSTPWLWKTVIVVISLPSVHTQKLLLVYDGKTDWKTEGLVSRRSED